MRSDVLCFEAIQGDPWHSMGIAPTTVILYVPVSPNSASPRRIISSSFHDCGKFISTQTFHRSLRCTTPPGPSHHPANAVYATLLAV
ncbi:hypothetical protein Y032_0502g2622 [Ancylostoma ceylanicum]|uniref:Uncharacterized protein n=1 Tax=Ancylostoma ceylanicum TaxID=53326 RepID=A0A016WVU8_9BILA|nr:hypothetical protein Y032_0502g2622 [Ancylostoma ceylanicum]